MSTKTISSKFVNKLLKSWRRGNFAEEDLESLAALWENTDSLDKKRLNVRDKLFEWVLEPLPQKFRDAVFQKDVSAQVKVIKEIFKTDNSNEQYCAILYFYYFGEKVYRLKDLEEIIGLSERSLRRYILAGIDVLINKIRKENNKDDVRSISSYVPSARLERIIGVEPLLNKITYWLRRKNGPQLISIEGIGGIGKTSVANHVLHRLSQDGDYEGFAWVNARTQTLSMSGEILPTSGNVSTLNDVISDLIYQFGQSHMAGMSIQEKIKVLRNITHSNRLLIVIDNLETIAEVSVLIPELIELAGKSHYLFTSRQSLSAYSGVRIFHVPELSLADSRRLVQFEIDRCKPELTLTENTFRSLYNIVGGIPLALKLAAAQFGFFPAEEIIQGMSSSVEEYKNFYIFIYRQSWMLLDDIGKKMLLSMLSMSSDGEDREWICQMADLSQSEFTHGLGQLRRLSLVELSGTVEAPRYWIHRLTATFLQTDILDNWESSTPL